MCDYMLHKFWPLWIESFFISDKKLPEYSAQQDEVFLLSERVAESKKIAQMVRCGSIIIISLWFETLMCFVANNMFCSHPENERNGIKEE